MIVIGIDPGSRATGYGIISHDGRAFTVVGAGVIRLKPSRSLPDRIGDLYRGLKEVIGIFHPDHMAVETAFLGRNVRSALTLGQVRGAVLALAMNSDLPVTEYAPREVKQAVTGSGAAGKAQVALMLSRILRMEVAMVPNDASDALGVAFCDLIRSGRSEQQLVAGARRQGGKKSASGWASFLAAHPDRVI